MRKNLLLSAAMTALYLPMVIVNPHKKFTPKANTVYKCGRYSLIVRDDKKNGLIGWLLDADAETLDFGYQLSENEPIEFGEVAGEDSIIGELRGVIPVTDGPSDYGASIFEAEWSIRQTQWFKEDSTC